MKFYGPSVGKDEPAPYVGTARLDDAPPADLPLLS